MARTINTTTTTTAVRTANTFSFLANARQHNVMTAEEEQAAFVALSAASDAEKYRIKESIFNANMRFLFSLVSKFTQNEVDDLVNEATIGMYEAMDSFEYTKGYRFITYAVHYMRMRISDYFSETLPLVKRSTIADRAAYKAKRMSEKFYAENGRYPSETELMDMLNDAYKLGIKEVSDLVENKVSYVDAEIGEDGDTAMEIGEIATTTASTNDYEREIEREAQADSVERAMAILTIKERNVITLSFGLDGNGERDNEAVGEAMGMSAENARLLKLKALEKMKRYASRNKRIG
jgi:RNA polymerase primary sigma factor